MEPNPCPQYGELPITQDMITNLLRVLSSGKKEYAYGTKKIVFASFEDIRAIISWMQRNINGASQFSTVSVQYNNGLNGPSGYYEGEEHDRY